MRPKWCLDATRVTNRYDLATPRAFHDHGSEGSAFARDSCNLLTRSFLMVLADGHLSTAAQRGPLHPRNRQPCAGRLAPLPDRARGGEARPSAGCLPPPVPLPCTAHVPRARCHAVLPGGGAPARYSRARGGSDAVRCAPSGAKGTRPRASCAAGRRRDLTDRRAGSVPARSAPGVHALPSAGPLPANNGTRPHPGKPSGRRRHCAPRGAGSDTANVSATNHPSTCRPDALPGTFPQPKPNSQRTSFPPIASPRAALPP